MKVMFICTENTCRSPMAQGLFEKAVKKEDKREIKVYSCGIYAENGGVPTYNAIQVMKQYNIDLGKHKTTNISNSNILDMDLILCVTTIHKKMVLEKYPDLKEKIFTLKEYVLDKKDQNIDINDPWGYDLVVYKRCAEEINEYLKLLIKKIK